MDQREAWIAEQLKNAPPIPPERLARIARIIASHEDDVKGLDSD